MKSMLRLVRDKGVFVLDCPAQTVQVDVGRLNGLNHGFAPLRKWRRVNPRLATPENPVRSGVRESRAPAVTERLRPKTRSTARGNTPPRHGRAATRRADARAPRPGSSALRECGRGDTPALAERPAGSRC